MLSHSANSFCSGSVRRSYSVSSWLLGAVSVTKYTITVTTTPAPMVPKKPKNVAGDIRKGRRTEPINPKSKTFCLIREPLETNGGMRGGAATRESSVCWTPEDTPAVINCCLPIVFAVTNPAFVMLSLETPSENIIESFFACGAAHWGQVVSMDILSGFHNFSRTFPTDADDPYIPHWGAIIQKF